jgi:hypothetical protein
MNCSTVPVCEISRILIKDNSKEMIASQVDLEFEVVIGAIKTHLIINLAAVDMNYSEQYGFYGTECVTYNDHSHR